MPITSARTRSASGEVGQRRSQALTPTDPPNVGRAPTASGSACGARVTRGAEPTTATNRKTKHRHQRERFEHRIRREVTAYALTLATVGEPRRKNGIDLAADEFTTNDATTAAKPGDHMDERARKIIRAMESEGLLTSRKIARGGSNAWTIYCASAALIAAERAAGWEPAEEDEAAFAEATADVDARASARVLRSLARKPTIPPRKNAEQSHPTRRPKKDARAERREIIQLAKLAEARQLWPDLPDGTPTRVLNRLLHDPPHWLWSMGEPCSGLARWRLDTSDVGTGAPHRYA